MKYQLLTLLFLFYTSIFAQNHTKSIGFIENKGQIIDQKGTQNKSVLYLLNTHGLNIQLKKNGFSYDVYETKKHPLSEKEKRNRFTSAFSEDDTIKNPNYSLEYIYHRIDIDFLNSSKMVDVVAEEKSTDYDNYYNVAHAPTGITNVHKYKKVTYKNIYDHIDVVFFIPEDVTKSVEYNFIVRPSGKVSDIQLQFNGVKTALVDNKIKMSVRFGDMEETLPMSWTEEETGKKQVDVHYKKIKNNVYGFEGILASDKTVIIDPVPVRLWGTYYGGAGQEFPYNIVNDIQNNLYASGASTSATNIATAGTYQSNFVTNQTGFIAKFDSNGVRIWGTYIANGSAINVDSLLNIYATGNTNLFNGLNIATPGCHQPIKNNYNDAYLIKLNSLGIREWGTYYGGEDNESGYNLNFDSNNNIYLCGETNSNTGISTTGSFQELRGSTTGYSDGYIAKFNANGVRIWASYYGGLNADGIFNCFISNDNFLYLTGGTNSTNNISTLGSYQNNINGTNDSMILKFNLNGNRIWGTYLGGEGFDYFSTTTFKNNFIYLHGRTSSRIGIGSTNTFIENFQAVPNESAGYATVKFDVINQAKTWGTYYVDRVDQISVNNLDELFFIGETLLMTGITTPGSYMPTKNIYLKVYFGKMNSNGQRVWTSYYGGDGAGQNGRISLDNLNNIYIFGNTNGDNIGIATTGAHQTMLGSNPDTFIAKFLDCQSTTTATSNSPICIGNSIQLNASGGINYSWIGPNGYTSNQQNPIITNATLLQSGQYACTITGSGSCDNTITVNVVIGDNINPIPNIANLHDIAGDCNTTITTIPTALDNCAGTIVATTNDPLNYGTSGTYTIHWSYNDGNGNTIVQNQNVIISEIALPILNSLQDFCIQQNASLNSIAITGQNIKWYDALTNGNILPNNTTLANGTTYYASQTITNCESKRVPVTINIQNTSPPTGVNQSFCASQNATLNDVIITGVAINWYATNTSSAVLPSTTTLADNVTYYATQTVNNCESMTRLPITITLINTLNANNFEVEFCDDLNDGTEIVNVASYNTNLISDTTNCTFDYYNSFIGATNESVSDQITNATYTLGLISKTIFVRITSSNGCHQIVELKLTLQPKPILTIRDIEPICENATVTIFGDLGYDDYTWSTGEKTTSITINNPGDYFLTVVKKYATIDCSTTKNFKVVLSNTASISEIITSDWTVNDNSIVIVVTTNSVGDYEYSLDGINYQSSNIFYGLSSGEYDVFIRDKNGCGSIKEEAYLLMYPKFFTPNGDGFNDKWKIKFSNNEPNLTVKIFDRLGKLLKVLDNNSDGWDGTFNGQNLPATDYWFTVIRANGKEYKGHFAMKR